MRVRTFALAVSVALALCILLAAMVPASWMARAVYEATQGSVAITDVQGSLWSGQGRLALGNGRWSPPLAWSLSPWPLVTGNAKLELTLANAAPLAITLNRHGVALSAGTLTLPASALVALAHLPLPVAPGGEVTLSTPGAGFADRNAHGSIDLRWQGARIADAQANTLDLGSVTLALRAEGGAFAGMLANSGGDAAISGRLALGMNAAPSIDLTLTPRNNARDGARNGASPLLQALAMFGAPAPGGGTRLRWNARGG
jgi:general secretion pathway protein N